MANVADEAANIRQFLEGGGAAVNLGDVLAELRLLNRGLWGVDAEGGTAPEPLAPALLGIATAIQQLTGSSAPNGWPGLANYLWGTVGFPSVNNTLVENLFEAASKLQELTQLAQYYENGEYRSQLDAIRVALDDGTP